MIILHIEHNVVQFDHWKAGFDSYAELRQKSGVRRFQIARAVDNPNYVMIDLEFEHLEQAEALLTAVQQVWQRTVGTLIHDPQWRLAEVLETKEFVR